VGVLIVIGAMGVFMRVIPTPFTQPAPTSVPTPGPTPQPAIAPQPATTNAAVATPAPVRLVVTLGATAPTQAAQTQPATVQPPGQPTLAPTGAPLVQPTTRPATAQTAAPTALPIVETTPAPTVDTALAAEILPAYRHYWQVADDALATLDTSKLNEVMDGAELVGTEAYVNKLRSKNQAIVGPEDHSITVVSATAEDAVIHDHVIDHGVVLDLSTGEPLPPDQQSKADTEIDGIYYLHKVDGVWKVVGEG
jgi:hypothetical protein